MTTKTWGIRFNTRPDFQRLRKGELPQGCPAWLKSHHVTAWQEKGVIIWNDGEEKIERLSGISALKLLDQLTLNEDWKLTGISIHYFGHEKTAESHPTSHALMCLPSEAGPELIEVLQANKQRITEIAAEEKRYADEAIRQCWEFLMDFQRKDEQKTIDFPGRSVAWRSTEPDRWSCQYQVAEGRVCLQKSKWFWDAYVRRPGFIGNSTSFVSLQEAVEWVEKELVELASQPEEEVKSQIRPDQQREADLVRVRQKLLSGPFWIDPAALEPKQINYKILIELDAKPVSFKTYESFCGGTIQLDKCFLSPHKLAVALNLDFDHFNIDQPVGENTEWYRITSVTSYYQASAAAEQAQKTWDRSQILQQFKADKIRRVRYGYQEVETRYAVFLGGCSAAENAWAQPISREDYLANRALEESLSIALDLNDYRDYLGVSEELISDEQILKTIHKRRSRSRHLPEESRRESNVWLAQHEPIV